MDAVKKITHKSNDAARGDELYESIVVATRQEGVFGEIAPAGSRALIEPDAERGILSEMLKALLVDGDAPVGRVTAESLIKHIAEERKELIPKNCRDNDCNENCDP